MIGKILELLCHDSAGLLGLPLVALIYREDEDTCIEALDDAELAMWSHVFNIDREMAKKLFLKRKPYEPWLDSIDEKGS